MMVRMPKIGDTVDKSWAIELCEHYGFTTIVSRIKHSPDQFKPWVFDGASMVPDRLASVMFGIPNLVEIALQHDLQYAYGIPGDTKAKEFADMKFRDDLIADGADEEVAQVAYAAVVLFGGLPSDFQWGFARACHP